MYSGKLTFVTFLWQGWRDYYRAAHVNYLENQLSMHISGDWELVCITNEPEGIDCETMPMKVIPAEGIAPGKPNCFSRLDLFSADMPYFFGSNPIVAIDLDCVILKDLRPLITKDDFKACEGFGSYLNGSMFQHRPGTAPGVLADYDPVETPKLIANTQHGSRVISGSDQAWLSLKFPKAPLWREADGVYQIMELRRNRRKVPDNARVVFFAGHMKPWDKDCKMLYPKLHRCL